MSFNTDSSPSASPPSTPSSLDPTDRCVGLSNPQLSQRRRHMLDLVNRLLSTGVQIDIDLPQIAVIGSQSAGKSSLIESISGITLPRAAGTCTRCPTECRLSHSSEPWQCTVSLQFTTDERGQPLGQSRNEQFGAKIFDKSEVEERIRRAQRAILNPNKSRNQFLEGADEDLFDAELTFSRNCVSLQISGLDVADLSFCDLPGLIASVGRGGNTGDVKLVENLVTSYIKKPSCIILLTVACETDFENQGAYGLAKTYDPDGKRTIGVLTKPDRIPSGEEQRWLPFIRNERDPLENNWFCVKQPSSSDLKQGVTWLEARKSENEFFSMTSPWSDLDPMYQKYLRTSNLVERLSSILSDLISKRLPQIQDELENSISKTQESLNQLPKAPSEDAFSEISTVLHNFTTDLSTHVLGVPDEDGLLQRIRPAHAVFRKAIRMTAPDFKPYERRYALERSLPKAKFLSNEEEDGDGDDDGGGDAGNDSAPPSPVTDTPNPPIYIDEVLARAQRARTRELPDNYPFVVQETYIKAFTRQWHTPAKRLCAEIHKTLVEHVKALVTRHFASLGQGLLEQRVKVIIQEHIKQRLEKTESAIDWLIRLENRPFTLNYHYIADYKSKFISYYKGSRNNDNNWNLMQTIENFKPPVPTPYSTVPATGVAKVLAGLVEIGIIGIKAEDLPKLLPSDPMEPALNIMADVRAYFQVAYKRFADIVPLAIDEELVIGLKEEVLSKLNAGLGMNSPEGHRICKEWTQESPQVADRREELNNKLERLHAAIQELLQIGF